MLGKGSGSFYYFTWMVRDISDETFEQQFEVRYLDMWWWGESEGGGRSIPDREQEV